MSQSMMKSTYTWVSTSWFEHTWESKRSTEHPLHLALLSNDCEHEFGMKWNSHAAVVIMLKLDKSIRCSLELGCIWIITYVLVYWLIVWIKHLSTAQWETKADNQVYVKCKHTQMQYVGLIKIFLSNNDVYYFLYYDCTKLGCIYLSFSHTIILELSSYNHFESQKLWSKDILY